TSLSGGATVALGGTATLKVNTNVIQNRVTADCAGSGGAIQVVNGDGSVKCVAVTGGIGASGAPPPPARIIKGTPPRDAPISDDGTNVAIGLVGGGLTVLGVNDGFQSNVNIVGGHSSNNTIAPSGTVMGATISGGGSIGSPNRVTDLWGTVSGGAGNRAGDDA